MNKQPEATAATRKKIMDSFWELYINTPIEKITISAITKRAGVHRSTFYEYFKDIYDVLEQLENDLLVHIECDFFNIKQNDITRFKETSTPTDLNAFMKSTLSFLSEHGELLYHLTGSSGDPAFRKKLFELFKLNFIIMHDIPEDSPYSDYITSLIFTITLNSLEYWFEHKSSITPQEIMEITYSIIGNGLANGLHFQ